MPRALFLVGLANAVTGWGLLKQREWGRIGALVLAVLRLFNFPLGPLVGALTLWYLLREDVRQEFRQQPASPEPAAAELAPAPAAPPEAVEPAPEPPAPPPPPES